MSWILSELREEISGDGSGNDLPLRPDTRLLLRLFKLGIVLKELNEAEVWIDILVRRRVTEGEEILRIQEDCKRLCRIIAASVRTAGRNLSRLNET